MSRVWPVMSACIQHQEHQRQSSNCEKFVLRRMFWAAHASKCACVCTFPSIIWSIPWKSMGDPHMLYKKRFQVFIVSLSPLWVFRYVDFFFKVVLKWLWWGPSHSFGKKKTKSRIYFKLKIKSEAERHFDPCLWTQNICIQSMGWKTKSKHLKEVCHPSSKCFRDVIWYLSILCLKDRFDVFVRLRENFQQDNHGKVETTFLRRLETFLTRLPPCCTLNYDNLVACKNSNLNLQAPVHLLFQYESGSKQALWCWQ